MPCCHPIRDLTRGYGDLLLIRVAAPSTGMHTEYAHGGSDIEEEGVKEGGSCGDEVRIFTFVSTRTGTWVAVAHDPGRRNTVGDKWVVSADTAATLKAAPARVGSQIK